MFADFPFYKYYTDHISKKCGCIVLASCKFAIPHTFIFLCEAGISLKFCWFSLFLGMFICKTYIQQIANCRYRYTHIPLYKVCMIISFCVCNMSDGILK